MASLSQSWNPHLYQDSHSFVWRYGQALVDLLQPQPGETIVDLGCGTGHLTAAIAAAGASVTGIDADAAMIDQARQTYPEIPFQVANARDLAVPEPVNAVFSNATLHWIARADQPLVARRIYKALRPNGRLVVEFGGRGNVQSILDAIHIVRRQLGCGVPSAEPWYFPSLGEYATLLEQVGFEVQLGLLGDRPTPLAGEQGLANWICMFASRYLEDLPIPQRSPVIEAVEDWLRPSMYREGQWLADYRRLRMVAVKPGLA
ncbi:SAM-dependent methyltransferase [filamentous cyanobacterium CCP5]|nr:SAM-dependent methyltransferase [filamentous cyanobacterium CCP5]